LLRPGLPAIGWLDLADVDEAARVHRDFPPVPAASGGVGHRDIDRVAPRRKQLEAAIGAEMAAAVRAVPLEQVKSRLLCKSYSA